jgi:hypothetical protein
MFHGTGKFLFGEYAEYFWIWLNEVYIKMLTGLKMPFLV